MKHNLSFIFDALTSVDNDPAKSMHFWNNPSDKIKLFGDILMHSVVGQDHLQGFEAEQRAREIIKWIDQHYDAQAWPLHDVHFHTNFEQYINCPFTCLNEITSNIEKMIKENFHA
jgi:hypothetical protein